MEKSKVILRHIELETSLYESCVKKKTARKTLHTALGDHSSASLRQRFDRMCLQMTFLSFCPTRVSQPQSLCLWVPVSLVNKSWKCSPGL